MNRSALDQNIRLHEGADFEPEPPIAHPRLMVVFLIATAWLAFIGAGYCAYRAIEALV